MATTSTHEVYPAAAAGTYRGTCRRCHHTTRAMPTREAAAARIELHVAEAHGLTPEELR